MKSFVVFLLLVIICSAAPQKNEKNNKKRGVAENYADDFTGYQSSFRPSFQGDGLGKFATPLHTSIFGANPSNTQLNLAPSLPAGDHLSSSVPSSHGIAPQLHQGEQILLNSHANALPLAANNIPVQFQTVIKSIPVPYERQIPLDNPIYTPVERHVPIDNPVPIVKYVTQHVPIHVEHNVPVPVIKEIRVPEPYLHKVRLVIQRVFVNEAPPKTYLPPLPPWPVQEPLSPTPNQNYISPVSQSFNGPQPNQNYLSPQAIPNSSHFPPNQPFKASPLAPPSTSYGVPVQSGY